MNNRRTTKRALLTSVMALVMCVVMLVGTTFAWFTDTASTGVNKIQAGNLKMEVMYRTSNDESTDSGIWQPIADRTDLFGTEDTLFEPGHTRVVELKITNIGNLAFKYKLGMNVVSEQVGTSKDGSEYKLSDYLKVATIEGGGKAFDKGSTGWSERPFASFELEENEDNQILHLLPGNEVVFGMKVYMPESVGNEANARTPGEAASIKFGLNILATQYTVESDSFGTDYDKDATYLAPGTQITTAEDLTKAIADGEDEVSITNDIVLDSTVKITKDTVIHGNGNTIKMSKADTNIFVVNNKEKAKLVLDSVILDGDGQDLGKSFPVSNGGNGTVEISNCTFRNFSGTRAVHSEQADTVKIVNTTFENISLTGESSGNNNNGRACLLWLQGTDTLLENVTIRSCKVLSGANNFAGSGILIYARNGGTTVTARNLTVENNVVSNHVFATYSTTNANTYTFESGSIKGNTVGNETDRTSGEIFMVGNLVVGKDMTIKQNITFNNANGGGVCTLTNDGVIVGDISATFTNRGNPIYTGTGTLNGLTVEQLKTDTSGYLKGFDIQ